MGVEYKRCCNCKQNKDLALFRTRITEKGTITPRSNCRECETLLVRVSNQKKMKELYVNNDPSIGLCDSCGFFIKRLTNSPLVKVREYCKTCDRVEKMKKNTVFLEARELLEKLSPNNQEVTYFIKKYTEKPTKIKGLHYE